MKKCFALALAAMMLLTAPVFAEETTDATEDTSTLEAIVENEEMEEAPASYEGAWAFVMGPANYGFDVYLPAGWEGEMLNPERDEEPAEETEEAAEETAAEVNAEEAETPEYAENVYYAAVSEDGAWNVTMAYDDLGEAKDAAALQQEYAANYEDAVVVTINEYDFVRYSDSENDAVVLLLPEEAGVHTFTFAPASDADYAAIVDEMIGTISVYEFEGEEAVEEEPVELNESADETTEDTEANTEAEG